MKIARMDTIHALTGIDLGGLGAEVRFPPASDWAAPTSVTVRQYLQVWAAHDRDHERAVRDAITIPPGPADLASSLRIRGRPT